MERSHAVAVHPSHALTRRAALGGVATGLLASLSVSIGQEIGLAQATPAAMAPADAVEPNLYALHADGVEIEYATSSETGAPTFSFSYEAEELEVSTSGDEIRVESVNSDGWSFGSLVSIYVDAAPDAWARSVMLVLPDINLRDDVETPFTTFAVLTRHLTTIAGPDAIEGQLQEYELIPLHGTARSVAF